MKFCFEISLNWGRKPPPSDQSQADAVNQEPNVVNNHSAPATHNDQPILIPPREGQDRDQSSPQPGASYHVTLSGSRPPIDGLSTLPPVGTQMQDDANMMISRPTIALRSIPTNVSSLMRATPPAAIPRLDGDCGNIKRARVELQGLSSVKNSSDAPPPGNEDANGGVGPTFFWISSKTMYTQPPSKIINDTILTTGSYWVDELHVIDTNFGSIQFVGRIDLMPLGPQIDMSDIVKFRLGGVEICDKPSNTLMKHPMIIVFTGLTRDDFRKQNITDLSPPITDGELKQLIYLCGKNVGAIYSNFSEQTGKWHLLLPARKFGDDAIAN